MGGGLILGSTGLALSAAAQAPVVEAEEQGWTASTQFEDLLDLGPEARRDLAPYMPRFGFVLEHPAAPARVPQPLLEQKLSEALGPEAKETFVTLGEKLIEQGRKKGLEQGRQEALRVVVEYSLGKMAICWRDQSSIWHYVENPTGCDIYSTSSESVYIDAGAGNDSVAANSVGHICNAGYTPYLLPFDVPGFSFYMSVDLGTGSDHGYGSSNDDVFESNYRTIFGAHPADNDNDFLCGYDGDDQLYGDGDHGDSGYWPIIYSGHEERLNGGLGSDYCHGGDTEDTYDWAMIPDPAPDPNIYTQQWQRDIASGGCNPPIVSAAEAIAPYFSNYAFEMKSDVCGDAPPNLWW